MAYGSLLADAVQSSTTGTGPLFKDGTGTQIGILCRAWVLYNAVSKTILGSFNVSSVTYSATGDYTVNFTNALPSVNYAVAGSARPENNDSSGNMVLIRYNTVPATTSVQVGTRNDGGGANDSTYTSIAIFS